MKPIADTVIFDMDGTLIDTEKYYRRFWPLALRHFGYEMSDEQALLMRSLGRPFAPRQLKEWFGQELDYYAVRDYRKELMEEALAKEGLSLKPGAVELLSFLKENGITAAVATATDMERTERYLQQLHIRQYFSKLISATMVAEGKPSPDIYLYACRELSRNPKGCIAVEDSPNGVYSAYRAGLRVIMVPDQTPADEALCSFLYAKADTLTTVIDFLFPA